MKNNTKNTNVNKVGATYFASSPAHWNIGSNPTEAITNLLERSEKDIDKSQIALWYIPNWEAVTHFKWYAPHIDKDLGGLLLYSPNQDYAEDLNTVLQKAMNA